MAGNPFFLVVGQVIRTCRRASEGHGCHRSLMICFPSPPPPPGLSSLSSGKPPGPCFESRNKCAVLSGGGGTGGGNCFVLCLPPTHLGSPCLMGFRKSGLHNPPAAESHPCALLLHDVIEVCRAGREGCIPALSLGPRRPWQVRPEQPLAHYHWSSPLAELIKGQKEAAAALGALPG